MTEDRQRTTKRSVLHPLPEGEHRRKVRRRFFRVWVGLTMVALLAATVIGPILDTGTNTQNWVAVFAVLMIALTLLGVGWLALYVRGGGRRN